MKTNWLFTTALACALLAACQRTPIYGNEPPNCMGPFAPNREISNGGLIDEWPGVCGFEGNTFYDRPEGAHVIDL